MSQGNNIETTTLEELFASSTEGAIPILLDIQHDALFWDKDSEGDIEQKNGHLRLINSSTGVKYKGERYYPCVFDFTPPSEDGTKISGASISISAIDQRIIKAIRSIPSPPKAFIEAFFSKISDDEFVFSKLYHYEFKLTSADWDNTSAKWTMVFDPALELNVPTDLATITRCPSIYEENN